MRLWSVLTLTLNKWELYCNNCEVKSRAYEDHRRTQWPSGSLVLDIKLVFTGLALCGLLDLGTLSRETS